MRSYLWVEAHWYRAHHHAGSALPPCPCTAASCTPSVLHAGTSVPPSRYAEAWVNTPVPLAPAQGRPPWRAVEQKRLNGYHGNPGDEGLGVTMATDHAAISASDNTLEESPRQTSLAVPRRSSGQPPPGWVVPSVILRDVARR